MAITRSTPSGWLQGDAAAHSRSTPSGWVDQPSATAGGKLASADIDAAIESAHSLTTSINAYVLGTGLLCELDAAIQKSATKTLSINASIANPSPSKTLSINAYIYAGEFTGISDALKEAYASAPSSEIVYHTLELYHPEFTVPIRVVRDEVELIAYLEAGAPRDPLAEVTFVPYAFNVVPPDVTTGGMPRCVIEIDNVSREILAQVQLCLASNELLTIIYRQYLSSDLTTPQNIPPLEMTVYSITANMFRIQATCGFTDFINQRFPKEDYTATRFPGLIATS